MDARRSRAGNRLRRRRRHSESFRGDKVIFVAALDCGDPFTNNHRVIQISLVDIQVSISYQTQSRYSLMLHVQVLNRRESCQNTTFLYYESH